MCAAGGLTLRQDGGATRGIPSTEPSSTTSGPRRTSPGCKPTSPADAWADASDGRRRPSWRSGAHAWTLRPKALDDIRRPEVRLLEGAHEEISIRLVDLYERRDERVAWFAGHPEAAHRLDGLDHDIVALNVVVDPDGPGADLARGPMRDRPWLRDVPIVGRSLDVGLER